MVWFGLVCTTLPDLAITYTISAIFQFYLHRQVLRGRNPLWEGARSGRPKVCFLPLRSATVRAAQKAGYTHAFLGSRSSLHL